MIQGSKGEIVLGGFEGGGSLFTEDADAEGGLKETPLEKVGWDSGYEVSFSV